MKYNDESEDMKDWSYVKLFATIRYGIGYGGINSEYDNANKAVDELETRIEKKK